MGRVLRQWKAEPATKLSDGEITHRWPQVVDEVFTVVRADAERAKPLVLGSPRVSARDALHAAVMERERITRIMSFDSAFDAIPGLTRLGA